MHGRDGVTHVNYVAGQSIVADRIDDFALGRLPVCEQPSVTQSSIALSHISSTRFMRGKRKGC